MLKSNNILRIMFKQRGGELAASTRTFLTHVRTLQRGKAKLHHKQRLVTREKSLSLHKIFSLCSVRKIKTEFKINFLFCGLPVIFHN